MKWPHSNRKWSKVVWCFTKWPNDHIWPYFRQKTYSGGILKVHLRRFSISIKTCIMLKWGFSLKIPVRNQQIYLRNEIISFMRIFKMEQTICKELAVFFDASSFEIQTICVENAWSLSVNYGKLLIVINFAWIYCYMHGICCEFWRI